MNPRMQLLVLFGGARATLAGGKLLSRKQLLQLAGAVQAWAGTLLLPQLTPEQRVRMGRGDLPGMGAVFLALREMLLSYPDLQKAIDITAAAFEELRQKGLELYTIAERAGDLRDGAAAAQAALTERLGEIGDQVAATAQRLVSAPATPAADRGLLGAILDGLDLYRSRRGDKKDAFKARSRRALKPLTEAAARVDEQQALLRLSASVLRTAGSEEAPGALLRAAPAPDAIDAPTTTRRRRAPAPEVLDEPAGAPLDECLEAPLARYTDCSGALLEARASLTEMGLEPSQLASPDSLDSLEGGDEALFVAQALRTSALLQRESGHTPEQVDELCGLRDAFTTLRESADGLARGAGDGILALGALVVLCCDSTDAWAEARLGDAALPEDERGLLRAELTTVRDALRRAGEPARRQQVRLQQRTRAMASDLASTQAEAHADAVVERLRAGEAVGAADLVAADTVQRRRARVATDLAAPAGKGRRRRR